MSRTSPKRNGRAVAYALASLLVLIAASHQVPGKDTWTSVRTRNFMLVGNASEKEIRQVGTKLEQFRDVFTRLFAAAKFNTPIPTTVIVFKSMNSYKPFNFGNNAGYFQKGPDVNYITLTTELGAQNPYSVIYHEYVHQFVDNTLGNVPVWFNEGLAEYYSSFDIEEDRKVHLGELIPYHIYALREEKLLPLRTLFAVDHYSPYYNESSKRGVFYAESWALVHYLLQANNGARRLQLAKFMNLLGAKLPIDEAFRQAFQIDVEAMEKELKRYIEGHSFRMEVATFERKLEFDNEMTSALISEADAQAYLGDLLLHLNRLDDAETRLQQALSLDPHSTMAQASLGIVRTRQGRFAEARKNLEAAVAGNSNNYLAHYYYAYAISREGMDQFNLVRAYAAESVATMRGELNKAIELNPAYPESYSLLAFVNLVAGEELDKSVELLKRALALSPGRQDLSLMLAQVYLRQGNHDLAKGTLEPLRSASDREVRAQAESILRSIKTFEEQLTRSQAEDNSEPPSLRQAGESSAEAGENSRRPSDYLQQVLRPVEAGEKRIQGLFVKLECDNKAVAYFVIQAGDKMYRLRAMSLERVRLTAYTSDAGSEITCGPRKVPSNVVVTFRPATDAKELRAKIDRDVVAVELVPKDFQLKP